MNAFLHFRIDLSPSWEPLDAERTAHSEAAARLYINPKERPSPYRVLWIGDKAGRNVALSVVPMPPDAPRDVERLVGRMKEVAAHQLASATDVRYSEESVLLGDSIHKFAAFRISATIRDTQLVQSLQMTLENGFLVTFTATGSSDQDTSEALQSLKKGLGWTITN